MELILLIIFIIILIKLKPMGATNYKSLYDGIPAWIFVVMGIILFIMLLPFLPMIIYGILYELGIAKAP